MAAHQAPPSPGFSRQEHWSGLPFPSPMYVSEKWKWSHSVVSDPQQPHGLQPTRLLCPWDFPGESTGVSAGIGEFNSDDHYIYYCRQESLRRNGVALIVNKRVRNEVLGCNLKNNRMISVPFQGICVNLFKEKFLNPLCDDSRGVWLILCFSRCRSEFPTFPPLQNCEFFGSFHYFNPVFLYIIICIWDYNTVTI